MEFESIANSGKLGIEFAKNSAITEVSKDFLEQLIRKIIKRSTDYAVSTKDSIFAWEERQLNSVVCPAIADLTDSYAIEYSIGRKRGRTNSSGRVDYWVRYNKKDFLMELKYNRLYFLYDDGVLSKKSSHHIEPSLQKASDQLTAIPEEERKLLSQNITDIALQIVVFCVNSRTKNEIDEQIDEIKKNKHNIGNLFYEWLTGSYKEIKPDLTALWLLDDKLIGPFNYTDYNNGFWSFPAVAFIGKIVR